MSHYGKEIQSHATAELDEQSLKLTYGAALEAPKDYQPKADAKKFILWGIGGTLVDYSDEVLPSLNISSLHALPKCGKNLNPEDAALQEGLISSASSWAYEKLKKMSLSDIARRYDLREDHLKAETAASWLTGSFTTRAGLNELFSFKDINLFATTKDAGFVHFAVTSGTERYGQGVLNTLAPSFERIIGSDSVFLKDGTAANKRDHAAALLNAALRYIPENRRSDVIVIDHGRHYMDAAKELGLTTAYMNRDKKITKLSDADRARYDHVIEEPKADAISAAFIKVLGVKPEETIRKRRHTVSAVDEHRSTLG